MIIHQAIRVCIGNGRNVCGISLHEEAFVLLANEQTFKPVGVVKDVVDFIGLQKIHTYLN